MNRRLGIILLSSMLILLVGSSGAFAWKEATPESMSKALKKDMVHPYLFFTEDEKAGILERIENDPHSGEIMDRFLAEGNRMLYTPVEIPIPAQLRDSRFDLSGKYLSVSSQYRRSAVLLAFLYQMTGDEKYVGKSFEFAEALCDLDTWVMRACQFPKAYPRVSPWNVPDEKLVFTFAIVASDVASDLSMVYDWLYPALDKVQRDRIKGALLEKAIIQVRGNYEFHWWATAYRCNWCAWVNTGLGLAALTLINDYPQFSDVLAESYNRISRTLSEIGVNGGWQEGGAYWSQTLRMSTLFADALKRATNGRYNHFKHPRIAEKAVNFPLYISAPPDYRHAPFADAHYSRLGSARLYNKIALETGNREAAWIHDTWFGRGDDMFDLIWPLHNVEPALPEQASIHFETIDWAVMRSDFTDPEKVMVACKAGMLDDPHHGHLDCGQFMVYWRGEGFIQDIGTAAYDEKYFDAEKYDTPHAASRGHNLIFVNGEQQIPGKLKDRPTDPTVGGDILEFRTGEDHDYVLMDPTNAYPKNELKGWRRHIVLDKPVVTVVVDEITCDQGDEIEARFHSDCEQVPADGYTLLKGEKGNMALIPVAVGADCAFRPGRHAYMPLFKVAKHQWIPYNGTVFTAPGKSNILAHVIVPVEGDDDAKAVAGTVKAAINGSGGLAVSFVRDGESFSYSFEMTDDGLVLTEK